MWPSWQTLIARHRRRRCLAARPRSQLVPPKVTSLRSASAASTPQGHGRRRCHRAVRARAHRSRRAGRSALRARGCRRRRRGSPARSQGHAAPARRTRGSSAPSAPQAPGAPRVDARPLARAARRSHGRSAGSATRILAATARASRISRRPRGHLLVPRAGKIVGSRDRRVGPLDRRGRGLRRPSQPGARMFDLIKPLVVRNEQDRARGRRRPGRAAGRAGRSDRARGGRDAQPGCPGQGQRLRPLAAGPARASRPAAGPAISGCSATTRSSTRSAAACSRRSASTSSCGPDDVAARGNFCTVDADGRDHRSPRRADLHRRRRGDRREAQADPGPGRAGVRRACPRVPLRPGPARRSAPAPRSHDTDPGRDGVRPLAPRAQTRNRADRAPARAVRRPGGGAPQGRATGQHGHLARHRAPAADALDGRGLRPARRRARGLPDVPGPRPPGRHDDRRARPELGRAVPRRCAGTGRTSTSSSCTTSTPTPPARTATSARKVELIEEFDAGIAEDRRARARRPDRDRRSQHAGQAQEPQLAPGAGAAGGRDLPADVVESFGERPCLRAGSASSRPSTCCRWPWRTPAGSPSSARERPR